MCKICRLAKDNLISERKRDAFIGPLQRGVVLPIMSFITNNNLVYAKPAVIGNKQQNACSENTNNALH